MSNDIIEAQPTQTALATVPATPADIVLYAMKNGGSIEQIRDFMQLQREWEADQARKAYVADMAEFKKNPPKIVKDKLVGYENRDGTFTGYKHATLGTVTNAVVEGLAKHGFSHAWEPEQRDNKIYVTCIITHKLGHSTRTTLENVKDDSGKKNGIQAMGSAITYLQRYTLLLACGLATHDQTDDDGQSAEGNAIDKLIADAARAPDLDTLQGIWNTHGEFLRETSEADWVALKDAVNGRKAALEKRAITAPGRSSRLDAIIGTDSAPARAESAQAATNSVAQGGVA